MEPGAGSWRLRDSWSWPRWHSEMRTTWAQSSARVSASIWLTRSGMSLKWE